MTIQQQSIFLLTSIGALMNSQCFLLDYISLLKNIMDFSLNVLEDIIKSNFLSMTSFF